MKLSFFKLIVSDLPAMERFYTEIFGFEVVNRIDMPDLEELVLAQPDEQFKLVLFHHKDGRALDIGTGYGPVAFMGRDIDGYYARIEAAGGTATRRPFAVGSMRVGFITDPEGHEIELIEIADA